METQYNNNVEKFKKQFLLSKIKDFNSSWQKKEIKHLNLFVHPKLSLTMSTYHDKEIYLLGDIYDYDNYNLSNQQLINNLVTFDKIDDLWQGISKFTGLFVLIFTDNKNFFIVGDAVTQQEIYYDTNFNHFASTPKLLSSIMQVQPHNNPDAFNFYTSKTFYKQDSLFITDTTHFRNIKHLLPNHYIDIYKKLIHRFWPTKPLLSLQTEIVADKTCHMLKGYFKAFSHRQPIALAVTAGFDSRVLFGASLNEECLYYIYKHKNMPNNHKDLTIPAKLTKLHNKNFDIIVDSEEYYPDVSNSIDFPKKIHKPSTLYTDKLYLDGNLSSIARNKYGYENKITADDLLFKTGYMACSFVRSEYEQWIKKNIHLTSLNYTIQDLFLWECRSSTLVGKARTQANALGINEISPFNSRELLSTLLMAPRYDREWYYPRLYIEIYKRLSVKLLSVPINNFLPDIVLQKLTKIGLFKHAYNLYSRIGYKR